MRRSRVGEALRLRPRSRLLDLAALPTGRGGGRSGAGRGGGACAFRGGGAAIDGARGRGGGGGGGRSLLAARGSAGAGRSSSACCSGSSGGSTGRARGAGGCCCSCCSGDSTGGGLVSTGCCCCCCCSSGCCSCGCCSSGCWSINSSCCWAAIVSRAAASMARAVTSRSDAGIVAAARAGSPPDSSGGDGRLEALNAGGPASAASSGATGRRMVKSKSWCCWQCLTTFSESVSPFTATILSPRRTAKPGYIAFHCTMRPLLFTRSMMSEFAVMLMPRGCPLVRSIHTFHSVGLDDVASCSSRAATGGCVSNAGAGVGDMFASVGDSGKGCGTDCGATSGARATGAVAAGMLAPGAISPGLIVCSGDA